MKLLYLISLVLISSTVILADEDDQWSQFTKVVLEEGSKQEEKMRNLSQETRADFTCQIPPKSNPKPTSVHKLQPGDIDVIAAIGDSLTAANGARAIVITSVLTQYRGTSWSIGGDEEVTTLATLPNILKKFNPQLYGFSLGSGKSSDLSVSRLNLAEPGHTSHNMPQQAIDLVNRMRADPKVNMDTDWKLITVFIGGNDLCKACDDVNKYTANNYVNNLRTTLYYLKDNLKRAYVNLVLSLDVTAIDDLGGTTCRNMQKGLCACGLSSGYRDTLLKLTKDIQEGTEKMVKQDRFDDRDDFAVVMQPFMTKMKAPLLSNGNGDISYFAPDCFHFSKKGHSAAGTELWNSMLTPVGRKPTSWTDLGAVIKCPTVTSPYLYTNENS